MPALRFLTWLLFEAGGTGSSNHDLCQMTAFVWRIARELSDTKALPEGVIEFRPNESILPAFPTSPCSLLSSDVQRVVTCIF